MVVTVQVQLDKDEDFTKDEIRLINAKMNEFCSSIERLSYLRCQLFVDNVPWLESDYC